MPDVEPHPATWGYIGRRGPRRAADSAGADAGRAGLRGSRGPPQAGAIALRGICGKQQVQPGHQVLINGAGGGSGMYAIQLAKLNGAEVTGVDNTEKMEFMRSLGADRVRQGVQHLAPLVGLVEAGKVATIIDRRYRLSQAPQALRYLGEGGDAVTGN